MLCLILNKLRIKLHLTVLREIKKQLIRLSIECIKLQSPMNNNFDMHKRHGDGQDNFARMDLKQYAIVVMSCMNTSAKTTSSILRQPAVYQPDQLEQSTVAGEWPS
jgi:hypothetical protein